MTFDASANRLDANIAIGGGTLRRPLLVVRGRSAGLPATPRLGGATLVQDVDDFPSPRAAAGELWIASACDLAGAVNRIEIPPQPRVQAGGVAASRRA